MRRTLIVMIAVAALAAGGVAATRLLDDGGGLVTPEASDPPTPTSTTDDARERYADPRGFTVTYPERWQRSVFELDVLLRPAGFPSLEQGEDTFGVSFQVDAGANAPLDCQGEELAQPGTDGTATVGGETVPTCEQSGDDGENWYRRTYTVAWSDHPCDHVSLGCDEPRGLTVTVRIVAATRALWDAHLADAEAVVESLRRSPPRPDDMVEA